MSHTTTFVICTEKGTLEKESVLLVRSLRKFGGRYSNAPVLSFQPRKGYEISDSTKHALRELNVEHIAEPLNTKYPHYPLANKPIVCAYAEQNTDTEYLAFLDSDVLIFNEPSLFDLESAYDVGVCPAAIKNIGATDEHDPNYAYWQDVFDLLQINKDDVGYVTTMVDRVKIFTYYNSGVVCARSNLQLFSHWRDNLYKVLDANIVPKIFGMFYIEQSLLAATISKMQLKVKILPNHYNYHGHRAKQMPSCERISDLQKITMLHYHDIFGKATFGYPLVNYGNNEVSNWVKMQVKEVGLWPRPFIETYEWWESKIKHRLKKNFNFLKVATRSY